MAIATYSDLKTEIASWLHRTDLTSVIPDFITLAESDFQTTLYLRKLCNAPTAFSATATFTDLPTDFRRMRSVALIANNRRYPMRQVQMDSFNTFVFNTTPGGLPHSYVISGGKIGIAPGTSASLEIEYWPKITALDSGSNTTTTLLTNYPLLYLYRACIEGAIYLRDDSLQQRAETMYARALTAAMDGDKMDQYGTAPVMVVV